ncbi:type III restriction endonuclease, partial [Candidatus Atribacteria bacterium HGW-Atribacteria-1]
KTENNFINKNHTKYLFRQNIVIDDKIINIRKVETFDDTDDIQIKFTSIHKLHNAVYLAKENSVTLEDLQKKDLVMIGDEAHHLNASTIRNGQIEMDLPLELKENASEKDIEKSWENTVLNKILRKGKSEQETENKNVLLEFTATIPKNADVIEKYRTKTIYKFELVDFLKAGYTKEINLVSTSLIKKDKILLALLFNWYRHQIALKNNVANFKPVVLFRSKLIEESKKDYEEFLSLITELEPAGFDFLKNIENSIKQDQSSSFKVYEQGKSRVKQMLQYIKDEKIGIREIAKYIKDEFAERNCIITNSKDKKAKGERGGEKTTNEQNNLLNSLEDKNNHIRAIFTVKRLTEGWDVLNLFDIVRLYKGRRDEWHKDGKRIAGDATVQEIQLIGRGVRYYPFTYNEHEKNKRKFDNKLKNPLRVLEEFYYHSDDDHRYLDELKRELKNKGFIQDNREIKKFGLKDEFKQSDFFKEIRVWKNEKIDNPEKRKRTLEELVKEFVFEYKTREFTMKEQQVILDKETDEVLAESLKKDSKTISINVKDFERHIVAKAINKKATKDLSLLRFDNLQNELNINSIDDIFAENFIGNLKINIVTTKDKTDLDDISNEEKLNLLLGFFDEFTKKLKEIANPHRGTEKFKPFSFEELFGDVKEKSVLIDQESKNLEAELLHHKWYILNGFNGTSEERELLEFIKKIIGNLEEKYDEVYLLRNEEVYKIYDFKQGRGFEPDFLLFLKGKKGNLYYQIFIEPKGSQFTDKEGGFKESKEGWKEDFLQQISNKYSNGNLLKAENKNYKLIGLPLFNKREENAFSKVFDEQLLK